MASKLIKDGVRKVHFMYIWDIENASQLTLNSKVHSPTFVVSTLEMTQWHLEAIFDDRTNQFIVFICREKNRCSESFGIDFEIVLNWRDEYPHAKLRNTSQFDSLGNHRCSVIFSGDVLFEPFPKETLTIRCRMRKTDSEVSQSDKCFARTYLELEQHSFVWVIKEFSSLRAGQNRTIVFQPSSERLPPLIFTLNLQEKDEQEYSYITVHRGPVRGTRLVDVEVSLIDYKGCCRLAKKDHVRARITNHEEKVCEFSEFFKKSEIMSHSETCLPDDTLSLRWHFEINAGPLWSRIENCKQLEPADMGSSASAVTELHIDNTTNACSLLKKVFKILHEDVTFSDISLKAESQSFSAHKNILGARSPVFKALFTKDMRENSAKCLDMPDMSADTLRCLLLYIYTNRVEQLPWKEISDLFRAAAEYEILDLKEKCSDFLKASISGTNACTILILAVEHHDEDLRIAVQDFISQVPDIFDSDAWKLFKVEYPKLALETTEQIIFSLRNSRLKK